MPNKLNNAARGSLRGLIWLLVLAVALSISAYSLYYVARLLGVPKMFAIGFSTAYDGVALIAADKSLQFAQEGKSGAFPRMVMILFAGLSSFLNSLHAILGGESILAIPMWAGLPLAAVAAFEIHTAQARMKAHMRNGRQYPAPMPVWSGHQWILRFLHTLDQYRTVSSQRAEALATVHGWQPRRVRRAVQRNAVAASVSAVTSQPVTSTVARRVTEPVAGTVTQPVTSQSAAQPARGNSADSQPASDTHVTDGDSPVTSQGSTVTDQPVTQPRNTTADTHNGLGVARNCEQCDRPFISKSTHARFCRDSCRVAWNRAKKRAS
jgi:hypothetical protein